ncbi:hypothetical protein E2P81_ATG01634 [Venturia nashicola]|nr:hypothetical protein E2P81_ATG01634 [Venturia nashicola]
MYFSSTTAILLNLILLQHVAAQVCRRNSKSCNSITCDEMGIQDPVGKCLSGVCCTVIEGCRQRLGYSGFNAVEKCGALPLYQILIKQPAEISCYLTLQQTECEVGIPNFSLYATVDQTFKLRTDILILPDGLNTNSHFYDFNKDDAFFFFRTVDSFLTDQYPVSSRVQTSFFCVDESSRNAKLTRCLGHDISCRSVQI